MKVVQVISRPNVGGLAAYVILAAGALQGCGHEVTVIYGQTGQDEGNMLDLTPLPHGVGAVFIPELGRAISPWRDLVAFFKLIRFFRAVRPDVVHTHASKPGALGRLAAWITRVPVRIHSYHGTHFHGRYFGKFKTRLMIAAERLLARLNTAIFTDTETIRRDLLTCRIGAAAHIQTMSLGTDLSPYERLDALRGRLRGRLAIPPDETVIGIVARLVPIKRLDVFLAAAKLVLQRVQARFVIAGDGELREILKQQAQTAGIADVVNFLGFWPDLREVYADADVMVLCSDDEGSPVALIEAMAAGKPIVATRVGGIPDVIVDGKSGVLVSPGDPQALAAAILAVIADSVCAVRLGSAAREHAFAKYSINASVEKTAAVYNEFLNNPQKGRGVIYRARQGGFAKSNPYDKGATRAPQERIIP
jgi:glycosyltransferase involved in cell wall biosynthesis